MFGFWGRIKSGIIIFLTAALPLVYLVAKALGRKDGQTESDIDRLTDANQTEHKISEFYREMADNEQDIQSGKLHNRDNLIERLRDKGL